MRKKQHFPQISALFATNSMTNAGTSFTNMITTSICRRPSLSLSTSFTGNLDTVSSLRTMASFIHQRLLLKQTLRTMILLHITELRVGVASLQRHCRCISSQSSSLPSSFSKGHLSMGKFCTTTSKNVLIFDSNLVMMQKTLSDSSSRLSLVIQRQQQQVVDSY